MNHLQFKTLESGWQGDVYVNTL